MSASRCQNCEWEGDDDDTLPVKHLLQRVSPGESFPTGECPECGALCEPADEREPTDDELYNGYGVEGGIPYPLF